MELNITSNWLGKAAAIYLQKCRGTAYKKNKKQLFSVYWAGFCSVLGLLHYSPASASPMPELVETNLKFTMLKESIDLNADPCTDFYQYACGNYDWKNPDVVAKSRFSNSTQEVIRILMAEDDRPAFQAASSYFLTCLFGRSAYDTSGYLKTVHKFIQDITINTTSLEEIVGLLHNSGLSTFMDVAPTSMPNPTKDSAVVVLQISKNSEFDKIKNQLTKEINNNTNLDENELLAKMEEISKIEVTLNDLQIKANNTEMETNTTTNIDEEDAYTNKLLTYNEVLMKLNRTLPQNSNFDWDKFLSVSVPTNLSSVKFVLKDENFITAMASVLFQNISQKNTEIIQEYASLVYLHEHNNHSSYLMLSTLPYKLDYIDVPSQLVTSMYNCALESQSKFRLAVGLKYTENITNLDKLIAETTEILRSMINMFKDQVGKVNWLDTNSKLNLVRKLDDLKLVIGKFQKSKEEVDEFYTDMDLADDSLNYIEKNLRISASVAKKLLKLPGRNLTNFMLDPIVMNAAYARMFNTIYVPAMLMNYFLPDQPHESLKYGSLGYVLGHEILHAVDHESLAMGINTINYNISTEGLKTFNDKAQCFRQQFHITTENGTIKNDGNATLNENIADAGGLKLAYEAYKKYANVTKPENKMDELDYTPSQLFFIGFAQFHCSPVPFAGDGKHSYSKLRVFGTLNNTREFFEAFDCPLRQEEHNCCEIW